MLDACIVYLNYRLKIRKTNNSLLPAFQALQSLKSQLELTA